jgi:hypothetical protein
MVRIEDKIKDSGEDKQKSRRETGYVGSQAAPHHYSMDKICFEKMFDKDIIRRYPSRIKAPNIVKKHQNSKSNTRASLSKKSKSKHNQGVSTIAQGYIIHSENQQSGAAL